MPELWSEDRNSWKAMLKLILLFLLFSSAHASCYDELSFCLNRGLEILSTEPQVLYVGGELKVRIQSNLSGELKIYACSYDKRGYFYCPYWNGRWQRPRFLASFKIEEGESELVIPISIQPGLYRLYAWVNNSQCFARMDCPCDWKGVFGVHEKVIEERIKEVTKWFFIEKEPEINFSMRVIAPSEVIAGEEFEIKVEITNGKREANLSLYSYIYTRERGGFKVVSERDWKDAVPIQLPPFGSTLITLKNKVSEPGNFTLKVRAKVRGEEKRADFLMPLLVKERREVMVESVSIGANGTLLKIRNDEGDAYLIWIGGEPEIIKLEKGEHEFIFNASGKAILLSDGKIAWSGEIQSKEKSITEVRVKEGEEVDHKFAFLLSLIAICLFAIFIRRRPIFLLFLLLLSPSFAIVEKQIIESEIRGESVVERVFLQVKNTGNQSIERLYYSVIARMENIVVEDAQGGLEFARRQGGLIEIKLREELTPNESVALNISYEIRGAILKGAEGFLFLIERYLQAGTELFIARLKLPVGMKVARHEYAVSPEANFSSDGERIIVEWRLTNIEEDKRVAFRVHYVPLFEWRFILFFMPIAAVCIVIVIHKFLRMKEERLLRGLSSDERKVVELLMKRRGRKDYQNNLRRELGLSRPKMTRIIKILEEKTLIKRRRIGRRNIITFVG